LIFLMMPHHHSKKAVVLRVDYAQSNRFLRFSSPGCDALVRDKPPIPIEYNSQHCWANLERIPAAAGKDVDQPRLPAILSYA